MRLHQLPNRLHGISTSETNQILKLFGHWPIPSPEFEIPDNCLSAIWLADYLATMGILDQAMRSVLLEALQPRMQKWTRGPRKTETDDCCARVADRKFLFFTQDEKTKYMDLSTGQVFVGLPKLLPVERLMLDIHAIFIRRLQETRHADLAT